MGHFVNRFLSLQLPKGQSAFLWGPRKTGKTTLLRAVCPKNAVFDFLETDLYLACLKRPAVLRSFPGAISWRLSGRERSSDFVKPVQRLQLVACHRWTHGITAVPGRGCFFPWQVERAHGIMGEVRMTGRDDPRT